MTCMGMLLSRASLGNALLSCFGVSVLGVCPQVSADRPSRVGRCWPVDRRRLRRGRSEGRSPIGAELRATYLYSVDPMDLDHDAVMRIGGRAPERWAHSTRRLESHSWVRVTTTSDRHRMPATLEAPGSERLVFSPAQAGRISTPTGAWPVVTKRRNSISSLRAMATISDFRVPWRPSAVRARYHCARALSFWNMRKRHASWIMPLRTRALPALASPFSRRFEPLSSGAPVRSA